MARNKHPEETVAKILDVSMRLFTEQGYEHTTIQDIVDALGMSKGAIYHHFKSKEDILDRINDRYYENLEWFSDPAKLPGRNGLEKLRHAFRHFLTDPAKREVDRLAIHHIVKNPKIALLTLESTFRDAAPYVEGMIRLGMADGSLPGVTHPHEIAEVLMLLTNVWTGMFPGSREEFAAKLRFMYGNLGDYFDHAVSYPWVGYLFTGMTPDEVQKLAAASHQYWADYGRYAEETWTSPVELPGKTGIVSIDFITGLTFTDELKDLYATLQANGIEVYIVSASPIDTVLAANETMGYNLPEDHVYAMRNKLGEDGRYINEYNYDWGGEGKYAQTQGEGKSTIITNFIAPQYDNAGPLMVFGDSSGDWNMMTDWMESGDTELGVIFNRYRKPSSDPIWQGSNEAAQSIGDPDARFVLQGRDENTGELRPSEKSILLGETDEVLVRPAE
mgnify:FL=1